MLAFVYVASCATLQDLFYVQACQASQTALLSGIATDAICVTWPVFMRTSNTSGVLV